MNHIFPKPVAPPKLVKSYGVALGRVFACISALFAVIHLFRIDMLLATIQDTLPNAAHLALIAVLWIVITEVFGIPFLLRMRLSRLTHMLSGFVALVAPLAWLLLSIWAYGLPQPTGQLGSLVPTYGSAWLVVINGIWLGGVFFTLWTLGYNNLKIKDLLKQ